MAQGTINPKHKRLTHTHVRFKTLIQLVSEEDLLQPVIAIKRCAEFRRLAFSDRNTMESTCKTKTYKVLFFSAKKKKNKVYT